MIDRIENWRQMSLNAAHCSSSTTPDDDLSLAKGIFNGVFSAFVLFSPHYPIILKLFLFVISYSIFILIKIFTVGQNKY